MKGMRVLSHASVGGMRDVEDAGEAHVHQVSVCGLGDTLE